MTPNDSDMTHNHREEPYTGIGICNPKNPTNMGSVLRACGCFGADEIYYTGTRYDKAQRFNTDTKNTLATLPMIHTESLIASAVADTQIVCVELVENATTLPEFEHPDRALYIFGAEDSNLSQELVDQAHHVVFIPTVGCLNLSASVHVLLYDRQTKRQSLMNQEQSNSLVRTSRDCRNNLIAAKTL